MDREYYSRGNVNQSRFSMTWSLSRSHQTTAACPGAESFGTEALAADMGIPRRRRGISECELADCRARPDVSRSLDAERPWRVPRTSGWWSGATTAPLESPPSD